MNILPMPARLPAQFRRGVLAAGALAATLGCTPSQPDGPRASASNEAGLPTVTAASPVDAGRYIVSIGGCNDCHTDGYMEANGDIPEAEWLTGSVLGFRGPWGTTYPPNLRLTVQAMTEDQWVEMLGTRQGLPPMPWPSVNKMAEADQRAVYRYLRSLGPKGDVRAAALPPGQEPTGPWFDFEPKNFVVAKQ